MPVDTTIGIFPENKKLYFREQKNDDIYSNQISEVVGHRDTFNSKVITIDIETSMSMVITYKWHAKNICP